MNLEERALALVRRMSDHGSVRFLEEHIAELHELAREAEAADKKWRIRHTEFWIESEDSGPEYSREEAERLAQGYSAHCPTERFEVVPADVPLLPGIVCVLNNADVNRHIGHDVTFGKGGPGGRCSTCHEDLTKEQGEAVRRADK